MIIFFEHKKMDFPDAAIFDFDGTLSKLRSGWETVMAPLMCELIPGENSEISELVKTYIDESTGIQTIHQMRWLADEIKKRGGQALDPWEYKYEYNRRLMVEVEKRKRSVSGNTTPADYYTVPGSHEFLKALKSAGVKLYAASGTDEPDVKEEARILGFSEYFDTISGASRDNDRCSKEAVLKELVSVGGKLLVVGDGKVEIQLGRKSGAVTLGVASWDNFNIDNIGLQPDKERRLKNAGAHALIADFKDTEEILSWL